jgi:hypothetical protein
MKKDETPAAETKAPVKAKKVKKVKKVKKAAKKSAKKKDDMMKEEPKQDEMKK